MVTNKEVISNHVSKMPDAIWEVAKTITVILLNSATRYDEHNILNLYKSPAVAIKM